MPNLRRVYNILKWMVVRSAVVVSLNNQKKKVVVGWVAALGEKFGITGKNFPQRNTFNATPLCRRSISKLYPNNGE